MPKITSASIREAIVSLYVAGYSQNEIAERVGMSKGCVNDILQNLREGKLTPFEGIADRVEDIHSLQTKLRRIGITEVEAHLGANIFKRLQELGTQPQELDLCIKVLKRVAADDAEATRVLKTGMKLIELEQSLKVQSTELPYEVERLVEMREKETQRLEGIKKKVAKKKAELSRLKKERGETLQRFSKVKKLEKSLRECGLNLEDVEKLEQFKKRAEAMGYDTSRLLRLSKLAVELRNRGKDEKRGLSLLEHWDMLEKDFGIDKDMATYIGNEFKKLGLAKEKAAEWLAQQVNSGLSIEETLGRVKKEVAEGYIELEKLNAEKRNLLETNRRLLSEKKSWETAIKDAEKLIADLMEHEKEIKERLIKLKKEMAAILQCRDDFQSISEAIAKEKAKADQLVAEVRTLQARKDEAERKLTQVLDEYKKRSDEIEVSKAIRNFLFEKGRELPYSLINDMETICKVYRGEEPLLRPYVPSISERIRKRLLDFLIEAMKDEIVSKLSHDYLDDQAKKLEDKYHEVIERYEKDITTTRTEIDRINNIMNEVIDERDSLRILLKEKEAKLEEKEGEILELKEKIHELTETVNTNLRKHEEDMKHLQGIIEIEKMKAVSAMAEARKVAGGLRELKEGNIPSEDVRKALVQLLEQEKKIKEAEEKAIFTKEEAIRAKKLQALPLGPQPLFPGLPSLPPLDRAAAAFLGRPVPPTWVAWKCSNCGQTFTFPCPTTRREIEALIQSNDKWKEICPHCRKEVSGSNLELLQAIGWATLS